MIVVMCGELTWCCDLRPQPIFAMELRGAFTAWRRRVRYARQRRYRTSFCVQHAFDVWWCTAWGRRQRRQWLAGRVDQRRRLVLWLCGAWWRWWATRRLWLRRTVPYFGPPLR